MTIIFGVVVIAHYFNVTTKKVDSLRGLWTIKTYVILRQNCFMCCWNRKKNEKKRERKII